LYLSYRGFKAFFSRFGEDVWSRFVYHGPADFAFSAGKILMFHKNADCHQLILPPGQMLGYNGFPEWVFRQEQSQ
jgi:hypothetical protein